MLSRAVVSLILSATAAGCVIDKDAIGPTLSDDDASLILTMASEFSREVVVLVSPCAPTDVYRPSALAERPRCLEDELVAPVLSNPANGGVVGTWYSLSVDNIERAVARARATEPFGLNQNDTAERPRLAGLDQLEEEFKQFVRYRSSRPDISCPGDWPGEAFIRSPRRVAPSPPAADFVDARDDPIVDFRYRILIVNPCDVRLDRPREPAWHEDVQKDLSQIQAQQDQAVNKLFLASFDYAPGELEALATALAERYEAEGSVRLPLEFEREFEREVDARKEDAIAFYGPQGMTLNTIYYTATDVIDQGRGARIEQNRDEWAEQDREAWTEVHMEGSREGLLIIWPATKATPFFTCLGESSRMLARDVHLGGALSVEELMWFANRARSCFERGVRFLLEHEMAHVFVEVEGGGIGRELFADCMAFRRDRVQPDELAQVEMMLERSYTEELARVRLAQLEQLRDVRLLHQMTDADTLIPYCERSAATFAREEGQRWVMGNVYSGTPWDYDFWIQKHGSVEDVPMTGAKNAKNIKMFYVEAIEMTFMVNIPEREIITWRMGRASE